MPIRPEFRKFYSGPKWQETRTRILKRAGNCCEECRKPNSVLVESITGMGGWFDGSWPVLGASWRVMFWRVFGGGWHDHHGKRKGYDRAMRRCRNRVSRVVLTVAHLNHTPGDDRDENLRALCQWCHLNWDRLHHAETRKTRKDARRPLLTDSIQSSSESPEQRA